MKFTINSKDFKSAVEKAAVCLNIKSQFVNQRSVYIFADSTTGLVTFSATDFNQCVNIFVKADIAESGGTLVEYSVLKRMLNIQGNITIRTVNKRIIATNGKKTGECCIADWKVDSTYYSTSDVIINDNIICTMDSGEFVKVIENLSKFVSYVDAKPEFTGIYFDAVKRNMVACDTYRMTIYDISDWNIINDKNVIIPAIISSQLKKITGKSYDNIKLYSNNKYMCIIADDFTFKTKLIDGKYMDYQAVIPTSTPKFTNKINIDELIPVLKEYKDICKGKPRIPMGMYFIEDKLYTSAFSSEFKTIDSVELVEYKAPDDEFIIGVNPELMMGSMQLYKSEMLNPVCSYYSAISAIKMVDGKYTMLVVPVRLSSADYIDKVKKLIA